MTRKRPIFQNLFIVNTLSERLITAFFRVKEQDVFKQAILRTLFVMFFHHSVLLLSPPEGEELAQAAEVLFQDEAHALGIERVAREIAVVGLVVDVHAEVAVGENEIAQVEVSDKRRGGVGVVAIAKLPVEDESVVEQVATEESLILGIVEALVASRDVGTEVPVVALHHASQHVVDLLAQGAAQQALHGKRRLVHALRAGIVISAGIEPAHG